MSAYLSLDLDTVAVEPALARRLPPGLAAYYLALPISCEDGSISVAMAHPENDTAVAVLSALLGAPIVPVRAPAAAIRRALVRAGSLAPARHSRVLVWSDASAAAGAAGNMAALFATALAASLTELPPAVDLQAALTVAHEGAYDLAIIHAPASVTPAQLWQQSATSLLLLRATPARLQHILVILRGYNADCHALEWLAPLLQQPGVAVTLLPLSLFAQPAPASPLSLPAPQHDHLRECLDHTALQGIPVFVRFRQGTAVHQVVAEASQGEYDLVVISAEGYGHFVSRVLAALELEPASRPATRPLSYFVLKPPAGGPTGERPATQPG
jgi:hypothetical protein